MEQKILENLWKNIKEHGLPLINNSDVKLFVNDFWDIDKLDQVVLATVHTKPIARMKLSKAILNMILFNTIDKAGILKGIDNYKPYIFTGSGNLSSQKDYCELIKDEAFNRLNYDMYKVADLIGKLKEAFVQFAWVCDNKRMMDISLIDIFELCDADEQLKDWILNGPIKRDDMSLEEVEKLKAYTLEYVEEVIDKKNIQPLKSLIAAGTGIRLAQFVDCLFMIGTRPDQDLVIPNIEPESWLRGLSSEKSFYYESYISRCATIITKLDIKDPGAFQKMVSYLNNPNYLNKNEDYMCDSVHYLTYTIHDEKELERVHDRYMIPDTSDCTKVELITKDRKDLIGKTIHLRSPATCNSKEGICKYCTGHNTYHDNVYGPLGSNANFGVQLTKAYISPEGQNFLSSKHNMVTIIEGATFVHDSCIEIKVKNIDIVYANGNIVLNDEYKIDEFKYNAFDVAYKGMIYKVESNSVLELREDGNLHVLYINKRKSKRYLDIKDLFSKTKNYENPIDELNKIIGKQYIIGETLLRNLIFFDDGDRKVKPDYSKHFDESKLVFVSLKTGIINNTGIVNKFCYGQFHDLISDPENYKPTAPMNYDILYADRSNLEDIEREYKEKYKKEIEEEEYDK